MDTTFLEALRKELPPTFSRQVAAEALKGIYSAGRLCTLDSMGKGPGGVRLAGFDGIAGNVQAQEELGKLISSGMTEERGLVLKSFPDGGCNGWTISEFGQNKT